MNEILKHYEELIIKYNKKVMELQQENKQLKEDYEKEVYLVDKLTRQLSDEYENIEKQCNLKNELQQENKQLKELLEKYKKECRRKTEQYEFLRHGEYVENLQQENKQLKDNWNKLKENIKRRKEKFDSGLWCELDVMRMFNYLIHELENGDSNE